MDERLRDGLRVWRKITSHEARRRQRQYLGKILRESDPDALRVELAAYWRGGERAQLDAQRWHDRLLRTAEHPAELQALMRLTYAVLCLQKKQTNTPGTTRM